MESETKIMMVGRLHEHRTHEDLGARALQEDETCLPGLCWGAQGVNGEGEGAIEERARNRSVSGVCF